jgi:hypothetical protein
MNVNQLSANGYYITEVFNEIPNFTFTVDSIRGLRHVHYVENIEFLNELITYFDMREVRGVEIWRDYPGYENHYHVDDYTLVENIAILYLGGTNTPNMGTGYIEEDQEFQINYKLNDGLVLKNSKNILHGMIGTVTDVEYRTALYFNWKS